MNLPSQDFSVLRMEKERPWHRKDRKQNNSVNRHKLPCKWAARLIQAEYTSFSEAWKSIIFSVTFLNSLLFYQISIEVKVS